MHALSYSGCGGHAVTASHQCLAHNANIITPTSSGAQGRRCGPQHSHGWLCHGVGRRVRLWQAAPPGCGGRCGAAAAGRLLPGWRHLHAGEVGSWQKQPWHPHVPFCTHALARMKPEQHSQSSTADTSCTSSSSSLRCQECSSDCPQLRQLSVQRASMVAVQSFTWARARAWVSLHVGLRMQTHAVAKGMQRGVAPPTSSPGSRQPAWLVLSLPG
jgi:hypothetical protein